ncbi:monofunctional biosynthetic peptidoglycan transglycosylase [Marinovum sp.]|uniref:monofunctional biosynthetic peptidoglycan transglycosylase n=1 Tax=Marinovum sp. TaxID=2024839 RepID=UPI003A956482
MAGKAKSKKAAPPRARPNPGRWIRRWVLRAISIAFLLAAFAVLLFSVFNPPDTLYMRQERARLGKIDHVWVRMENIAPVMARSAVAAEDANFCNHWGFDVEAIKAAMAEGGNRGASTISQQVVKNVYLWHGRNWGRKLLEAGITPLVEAVWSKRRILEVYLNVAEFDEGVFGVEAAARHYFGVGPGELTPTQAARLAMVLPNPKERSASKPTASMRKRSGAILDGAATIERDGRAACFQ